MPADSADMMYYPELMKNLYRIGYDVFRMSDTPRVLMAQEKISNSTCYDSDKFIELCAPCWSVGRLMEIFIICTPYVEIRLRTRFIEQLIASYEDVIKQGMIDFSKLED